MFFIFVVVTFVALTVRPLQYAHAMHLVVLPHAVVLTTVAPGVGAFPFDVVGDEVALVTISIGPGEDTVALFNTCLVITFKLGAVGPSLHSSTVLRIVLPEATVQGAILMEVITEAVGLVIFPLSLVDVTILVKKSTEIICLIVFPVSFIQASVGPDLHALAFSYFGAY